MPKIMLAQSIKAYIYSSSLEKNYQMNKQIN